MVNHHAHRNAQLVYLCRRLRRRAAAEHPGPSECKLYTLVTAQLKPPDFVITVRAPLPRRHASRDGQSRISKQPLDALPPLYAHPVRMCSRAQGPGAQRRPSCAVRDERVARDRRSRGRV